MGLLWLLPSEDESGAASKPKQLQYMKLPGAVAWRYLPLMAESKGYGQFCPVAQAAQVLAERWTPLVVRELICGSVRFNDLQRGVPRMSSSLLSRRLKELEYAGIVERRPAAKGRGSEYHLTDAGRELFPIVEGMGLWAQRWLRRELVAEENLDPDLLMWDIRRCVTAEGLPPDVIASERRFVVRIPDSRSTSTSPRRGATWSRSGLATSPWTRPCAPAACASRDRAAICAASANGSPSATSPKPAASPLAAPRDA
jgi:DNA-binding HxlR family transcriptional regulator